MNANKKSGKKSATVSQKNRQAKKPTNTVSLFQKFTGLTLSEHLKLKKQVRLPPKPTRFSRTLPAALALTPYFQSKSISFFSRTTPSVVDFGKYSIIL